ncbi:MAG: GIY-YIG nuclease family protein [Selenomonadaceae bacterium]|nr:GIY-YIG nuclease family protein [Selenomonadaceae bacterium]
MKVFGVIYLIINGVNDKEYVGQTTKNVKARFKQHARRKNSLIGNAIRAYGEDMFVIAILKVCYSKEELDFWEKHFIKSRNTMYPNGYNLTDGGEGGVPCDAVRAKIGAGNAGENNGFFGKHHTKEELAIMSAKQKGRKRPPEVVAKSAAANRGQSRSKEAKKLMSNIHKGKKHSSEHRAKLAASHRNETCYINLPGEIINHQFSYKVLAKILGVSSSTFSNRMSGAFNFTAEEIAKFVELFGLPAEYLFERDDGLPVKISKNYYQTLYKNLSDTMTAKQISYTELAKLLKVSQSAISMKMTGKRNFTDKDIAKLEEIFDLPAKYLMARTDK